jgi:hypothetical protein
MTRVEKMRKELALYGDLKFDCEGTFLWWPISEARISSVKGGLFYKLTVKELHTPPGSGMIYGRFCRLIGRRKFRDGFHQDETLACGVCFGFQEGAICMTDVEVMKEGNQALKSGSIYRKR